MLTPVSNAMRSTTLNALQLVDRRHVEYLCYPTEFNLLFLTCYLKLSVFSCVSFLPAPKLLHSLYQVEPSNPITGAR